MPTRWNVDAAEMKGKLDEARKVGHARLFAIAYDADTPVQWHHAKDETAMKEFLDSRERSESILFNCAIAVAVVNPQDSDETIEAVLTSGQLRQGTGPGYFSESF